MMRIDHR